MGPIVGLVYQSLWCMADDGGVAKCTAEEVKGQMFMYWPSIGLPEISDALEQLATAKRLERYTIGDDEYARIVTFDKHQSVHNPSQFRHPRPPQQVTASEDDRLRQDCGSTGGGTHILDTYTPRLLTNGLKRGEYPAPFNELRAVYPKRSGGDSKDEAYRQYQARLKQGETHEAMLAGATRYKAYCDATGKTGTEYVKQMATFLGRSRHYLELWEIPAKKNGQHSADEFVKRGYV